MRSSLVQHQLTCTSGRDAKPRSKGRSGAWQLENDDANEIDHDKLVGRALSLLDELALREHDRRYSTDNGRI